jgi:acyl carrier protein
MATIQDENNDRVNTMDASQLVASIIRRDTLVVPDTTLLSEIDGWDSLKGVRLVLRLEEITGRELLESEIEGLQMVGDVGRILNSTR